jgi:hypothetical protein
MKNLSLLLLVSVMLCGVANADIVDCGQQPLSLWTYGQWSDQLTGVGNGCEIGDKIFSNFSTGSIPTGTAIQFGSTGPLYTVNFIKTSLGGFRDDFTESYSITIDPTKPPASLNPTWIAAVATGMQDSNGNGNAAVTKLVTGDANGTASAIDVNGTIVPSVLTGIHAQKLDVTDSFTYKSGVITNVSNSFLQVSRMTDTPEPASMALIGGGLLALCFARRRRA